MSLINFYWTRAKLNKFAVTAVIMQTFLPCLIKPLIREDTTGIEERSNEVQLKHVPKLYNAKFSILFSFLHFMDDLHTKVMCLGFEISN